MPTPALFLDRDGVINVDHAYVHRIEDFEFIPGIFELCRAAKARGMKLVVVTNQAGIGRGLYTEADFHTLTAWMKVRFEEEGAALDGVYFCPTHPTAGNGKYRVVSSMRKPGPGMLLQAALELDLDLERSVIVGDKESDMLAGQAARLVERVFFNAGGQQHSSTATRSISELADGIAALRPP